VTSIKIYSIGVFKWVLGVPQVPCTFAGGFAAHSAECLLHYSFPCSSLQSHQVRAALCIADELKSLSDSTGS
jgi:hypothetical protein